MKNHEVELYAEMTANALRWSASLRRMITEMRVGGPFRPVLRPITLLLTGASLSDIYRDSCRWRRIDCLRRLLQAALRGNEAYIRALTAWRELGQSA